MGSRLLFCVLGLFLLLFTIFDVFWTHLVLRGRRNFLARRFPGFFCRIILFPSLRFFWMLGVVSAVVVLLRWLSHL